MKIGPGGPTNVSDAEAEIAFLKLTIKKLQREIHGRRSERKQRLLDQPEIQLDELEATATEDELAADQAAVETTEVQSFIRCLATVRVAMNRGKPSSARYIPFRWLEMPPPVDAIRFPAIPLPLAQLEDVKIPLCGKQSASS